MYFGIDCFGRGTLGGGGFNSILPLSLLRPHGFSAAVFAPAWTYEMLEDKHDFAENSKKSVLAVIGVLPAHEPRP